ncbi:MAG: pyridoxal-phosphate dependent enzyme [Gammaproteobacteria bacterium]
MSASIEATQHIGGETPAPGVSLDDIRAAHRRIAPHAHRTPVLTNASIDEAAGASLFFKCENLQRTGAFKLRGALNAVYLLDHEQIARGVATHSSGNHAAALSYAARLRGSRTTVVMPNNANAVKRAAVLHYGGEVIECEPTQAGRENMLDALVLERGLTPIPPFDDLRVVAGQGTAALELLEQAPELDAVIAPVGGGGLLSGTAIAVTQASPGTQVIGAEPDAVDDTYRSFLAGHILPVENPETIADGLRTTVGLLTFPIIRRHASQIVTVTESMIVEAMRLVWQRMKVVVEPSAAVALAAVLKERKALRNQRIGIIFSGGNVDLDTLPWQ